MDFVSLKPSYLLPLFFGDGSIAGLIASIREEGRRGCPWTRQACGRARTRLA